MTARRHVELTEAARKLLDDARSNLRCDEIALSPLESEEIQTLVRLVDTEADPDVIEAVQRYSGGNPFYALEITRSLIDATPTEPNSPRSAPITPQLRDLLALRVSGLDRDAARILESVAVLDRHAAPTRVAKMAGLSLDAAAESAAPLYHRRLLEDSPGGVGFPHDIVREFVYDRLGSLKRTALHLRAGELLTEESAASPAVVARHFSMGGEKKKAYAFAIRAAEQSAASSAHEEAAAMAELAATCALTDDERAAALTVLARARFALAHFDEAARVATTVLERGISVTNHEQAELWLLVARSVEPTSSRSAAQFIENAEQAAMNIAEPIDRYERQLEVLHWQLRHAWNGADSEKARSALSRIEALWRQADMASLLTPAVESRALCSLAAYHTFYESSEYALNCINRAIALADNVTPGMRLRVFKLAGAINTRLGKYEKGETLSREALAVARELCDINEIATLWNNVAASVLDRGNWTEIERIAQQVRSLECTLPHSLPVTDSIRINQADAFFYQGRFAEANELVEEVMNLPSSLVTRDRRAGLLCLRGLIQLRSGHREEARSTWQRVLQCAQVGLRGEPHRYKIEWFRHSISRDVPDGPSTLHRVADEERQLEYSNYLKLRWLSRVLYPADDSVSAKEGARSLRRQLGALGMGWFADFTERWTRQVRIAV